jgi:hypothetical protein
MGRMFWHWGRMILLVILVSSAASEGYFKGPKAGVFELVFWISFGFWVWVVSMLRGGGETWKEAIFSMFDSGLWKMIGGFWLLMLVMLLIGGLGLFGTEPSNKDYPDVEYRLR